MVDVIIRYFEGFVVTGLVKKFDGVFPFSDVEALAILINLFMSLLSWSKFLICGVIRIDNSSNIEDFPYVWMIYTISKIEKFL